MQWTPEGAHLQKQVRTDVLDEDWKETFQTSYPQFGIYRCHMRRSTQLPDTPDFLVLSLKLRKRQLYGRASFDLLRQCVLNAV